MTHDRPRHRTHSRGITLPELLTAIGIIGLLLALTFPVIAVLRSSTTVEAGLITVGMAADVARQWVEPERWANDGGTTSPINEKYSGTAALYCPTGEIRILVNQRNASFTPVGQSTKRYLEDMPIERNGYADIEGVDYISIQDDIGVAGIYRSGAGSAQYIAPPFAVAFSANGQMNFGDVNGKIYYDKEGDGNFVISSRRLTNYKPLEWNGDASSQNASPNADSLVRELPFEAIECVPGLVVYNQADYEDAKLTFGDGSDINDGGSADVDSDAGRWLAANGRTLFFSQNSGIALRDE